MNLTHLILSLIFNVLPGYPRGAALDGSAGENARNAKKDRMIPLVITGCETISLCRPRRNSGSGVPLFSSDDPCDQGAGGRDSERDDPR